MQGSFQPPRFCLLFLIKKVLYQEIQKTASSLYTISGILYSRKYPFEFLKLSLNHIIYGNHFLFPQQKYQRFSIDHLEETVAALQKS